MFDAAARTWTVPKKNATAGIPQLTVIPKNVSAAAIPEAITNQVVRKAALSDHLLARKVSRGLTSCFWRSSLFASVLADFSSKYRRREYTANDCAKSNARANGVCMSSVRSASYLCVVAILHTVMAVILTVNLINAFALHGFERILSLGLLVGEAKVFKHGKAQTLYVTIPSAMAQDSAFTIKEGDVVEIKWDKEQGAVVIRPKPGPGKKR